MADPTPAKGLPDVEYIELYNTTNRTISLKGWKLAMGTRSVVLPDSVILPGSYTIVCHRNSMDLLAPLGSLIGLSSFSLTNEGMLLALQNNRNKLIYAISYQNKWWQTDKRDGGYSLEMVDVTLPCLEKTNWRTTANESGGTPGRINSFREAGTDVIPPVLERVDVYGNAEIQLVFDKKMDSLNAVSAALIELAGRKILKRELTLPDFHTLKLILDAPLLGGQEYRLSVRNISDCSGNILRETERALALPAVADSGDVVINEILFNPFEGGVDFVELYNRSSKHISIKDWSLGNVKTDGTSSFSLITALNVTMPPNGYLALTTDVEILQEQYPSDTERQFFQMNTFPSFPNTEGGAVLRNNGQQLFDKMIYDEKMHHALVTVFKGISLERMDSAMPSGETSNWHSASSTVGYATPGYSNSQIKNESSNPIFYIEPEAFSPDGDGVDDFANLHYQQNMAGNLATIRIFNAGGRSVKNLIVNQLLGTSGTLQWDGTDDQGAVVGTGYYFIVIDTFSINGQKQHYKCKVVVANRRN
ncbi:lamin tail domain-containing protein [Dyadobacter sp. CY312]|nr:lamin tail domain-containing protein [Dyadobacter sp. CY312]